MKTHLAVLSNGWIDLILDGNKTIESRFSKNRCAPFGKVSEGDIIYLKEISGDVLGCFKAGKIETYQNLTDAKVHELYSEYVEEIFCVPFHISNGVPDKWLVSKYATLIHITNPVRFETPTTIKKSDRRAWVVMGENQDVNTYFD